MGSPESMAGNSSTADEKSQKENRRAEFSLNESSLGILDLDAIQCEYMRLLSK